jgi:UDP-glucose 4-epimerase
MRIVMTGSNGVIGRVLLDKLVAGGHETIALLRPGTAPRGLDKSVTVIEVDLAEPLPVRRLPERADAVVHLAHSRSYRDFPEGAPQVFQINTALTVALADYARRAGASRFLYSSTGTVYQSRPELLDEKAATAPASFYAAAKLAAEHLLVPYSDLFGVFIARLFYVYGPGQKGMLVANLAQSILAGKAVTLRGAHGAQIAPLYSDDAAHVLHEAISENWTGTWNVGHPESTTIRHLATDIGRIIGREPLFEQVSFSAPIPCLPCLDRLAERVDLSRFVPLREGLSRMFVDLRHVTAT